MSILFSFVNTSYCITHQCRKLSLNIRGFQDDIVGLVSQALTSIFPNRMSERFSNKDRDDEAKIKLALQHLIGGPSKYIAT